MDSKASSLGTSVGSTLSNKSWDQSVARKCVLVPRYVYKISVCNYLNQIQVFAIGVHEVMSCYQFYVAAAMQYIHIDLRLC